MNKATVKRLMLIVSVLLVAVFIVSACDSPPPRIPQSHFFNPGGPFQTNISVFDKDGNPDPRRQIRCSIIFEVLDEAAVEELGEVNFIVRNSVLQILGELTVEEITTERNLDDITQRLVDRINEDINSNADLVLWAYFTDIALV